jgi:hypothetical protein
MVVLAEKGLSVRNRHGAHAETFLNCILSHQRLLLVIGCLAVVSAGGCGRGDLPNLGRVTGTIRYNGKALPGAKVLFRPISDGGGRMATGFTDSAGEYRLLYIKHPSPIYGAMPGPQLVVVSTALDSEEPGGPTPETLPACYRGKASVLAAEVKPGNRQQIDFNLDAKCAR